MKPRIAFVLGDPNGIGPEIAAKLLSRPAVVGAAEVLVQEGKNGFTFLPEDTAAFTACLHAALNPTALMMMSLHARAIAEETSAHVRARAVWTWMGQHFSL
jgi:4-hydroxy-L-threonine phosphate dehydrogenase PdxA